MATYKISAKWLADARDAGQTVLGDFDTDMENAAMRINLERHGIKIANGEIVGTPEGVTVERTTHKRLGYAYTLYGGRWGEGIVYTPEILNADPNLEREYEESVGG